MRSPSVVLLKGIYFPSVRATSNWQLVRWMLEIRPKEWACPFPSHKPKARVALYTATPRAIAQAHLLRGFRSHRSRKLDQRSSVIHCSVALRFSVSKTILFRTTCVSTMPDYEPTGSKLESRGRKILIKKISSSSRDGRNSGPNDRNHHRISGCRITFSAIDSINKKSTKITFRNLE